MVVTLNGAIQFNRGGHPYVVVTEAEDALHILESCSGKNREGSSPSGARTFHAPVAVLVGGVAHTATGIGARFYEEETTRERNPRNGKIRVTTARVEGSGSRYVYLAEAPRPLVGAAVGGWHDDLDEDERAAWGAFGLPAADARREDA